MMTPTEATTIRLKLGLTVDAFAAELGVSPAVVVAWEAERLRVPPRLEKELRWRAASLEREEALASSGLADCAWVMAWEKEPIPEKLDANTAHLERLVAHQKACPTCQARESFVLDRFGPMPTPPLSLPGWVSALSWFGDRVEKWPEWARPVAWTALAFGAYSLIRLIFMIPALMQQPSKWWIALGGLAASIAIGGALGLVIGAIRMLRKRTMSWRRRDHIPR